MQAIQTRKLRWYRRAAIRERRRFNMDKNPLDKSREQVRFMPPIQLDKLLNRPPITLDEPRIKDTIEKNTVIVTGAGGSIGSEICRQVIQYEPASLILFGHGENSIYEIEQELLQIKGLNTQLIVEIADIQDREKTFAIVNKYRPAVIYHAAAHKHVPLMERNPDAAVKNNIFGTKNIAEAADCFGVKTFVLVSTDKAVYPTSVMGATKRVAEMIIQQLNEKSPTKYIAVRFGNVLGSRGSVIPFFLKQIQQGGPITITHPDMTRYFMTISDAARLVIQGSTLPIQGGILLLDMGEPIRIVDLAEKLILQSGYQLSEIPFKFIGIRPGEKLTEELFSEEEKVEAQIYLGIYYGKQIEIPFSMTEVCDELKLRLNAPGELTDYLFDITKHPSNEGVKE